MTKPTGKRITLTLDMLKVLRMLSTGKLTVVDLAHRGGWHPDTHEVQRWVTSIVGKGLLVKNKVPGVRSPSYSITDAGREYLQKVDNAEA